jgi:hypothetical protein
VIFGQIRAHAHAREHGKQRAKAAKGEQQARKYCEGSEMKDLCPKCGLNLALVGARHNCRPRLVKNAEPVKNGVKNVQGHVKNAAAANGKSTARTRRWREAHRDESRAYMRDYMRRRREAALANAEAG